MYEIHMHAQYANIKWSGEKLALSEIESESIFSGYFTLQADLHNRVTVYVYALANYLFVDQYHRQIVPNYAAFMSKL